MSKVGGILFALAALLMATVGCRSPYGVQNPRLAGGLAGAGVGALIGEAADEPLAGAAIGGLVGTAAGGAASGQGCFAKLLRRLKSGCGYSHGMGGGCGQGIAPGMQLGRRGAGFGMNQGMNMHGMGMQGMGMQALAMQGMNPMGYGGMNMQDVGYDLSVQGSDPCGCGGCQSCGCGCDAGVTFDGVPAESSASFDEFGHHEFNPPQQTTVQDLIAMSNAGLSEEVIMNYLETNGPLHSLHANDLISLKEHGVGDSLIASLQKEAGSTTVVRQVASSLTPAARTTTSPAMPQRSTQMMARSPIQLQQYQSPILPSQPVLSLQPVPHQARPVAAPRQIPTTPQNSNSRSTGGLNFRPSPAMTRPVSFNSLNVNGNEVGTGVIQSATPSDAWAVVPRQASHARTANAAANRNMFGGQRAFAF